MKGESMKQTTGVARWMMVASVLGLSAVTAQAASCNEELLNQVTRESAKSGARGMAKALAPSQDVPAAPSSNLDPQSQLQTIAREASRRSAQLGAARLLAEAAAYDVDETRGAALPQVSVTGNVGPGATRATGIPLDSSLYASASVNVSGLLYDGGRLTQLTQWRRELAGAAKFSAQSAREQVVLETISTALERNRYRQQAQVYQQYTRKMACLVDALQQIVAEDRGRASELLQVRKNQAQAELARDAALVQMRQTEIRLRKLIGDQAALGDSISAPLSQTLDTGEVLRLMEQNSDFRQLRAQADASDRYADAVAASDKPQVSWVVSSSGGLRGSDNKSLTAQAGLSVSYSVFNGGSSQAAAAAAARRAESTRQQYAELVNSKSSRVSEVHESAIASFDRARRFVDILKDSDKVRAATFQQWSQLGRRSLFDVMSAESDHFNLRIAYVNALHDGYQANAQLRSMGEGLSAWLGINAQ